ncbi:hypothetical protein GGF45_003176 [Coemansia sp. RSA 551]|nr:hypothetical protein GGF45_003176 [Coemansia sp. RSA 551]
MRYLAIVGLYAVGLEAAVPNGARAQPIIVENQVSRVGGNNDLPELIDIGPLVSVAAKLMPSSKPPTNSALVHTSASLHPATMVKNVEPSVTAHAVSTTIDHPHVSVARAAKSQKPSPVSEKGVESKDFDKEASAHAVSTTVNHPHVSVARAAKSQKPSPVSEKGVESKDFDKEASAHAVSTTVNHPHVSASKAAGTQKPSPVSEKGVESKDFDKEASAHAVSTTINHPHVSAVRAAKSQKPSPVSEKDVEDSDDNKEASVDAVDTPKSRPHVSAYKKVVVNKVKVTTVVDESTNDGAQSDFDLLNQYARLDESSANIVSQGWALVAVVGYFCVTNYF